MLYPVLVLICAISSSHGVKLNVHGQMSVGRNAAGLLNKLFQIYNEDNTQNQQSKEGIRNNPNEQTPGNDRNETINGQHIPFDSLNSLYEEFKKQKHKHGYGHKHHKKHHHHDHDHDYYYYYSSYEDRGNKKHIVIPQQPYNENKKHIVIPQQPYNENKKHIVIPQQPYNENKKHIVIPQQPSNENKKHIVIPSNDNDGIGNKQHIVISSLVSMMGKQNERDVPYSDPANEQHSQVSRDNKKWRPPQYGSEENKKRNNNQGNGNMDTPAEKFLRQLWNMFKAYREPDRINLF